MTPGSPLQRLFQPRALIAIGIALSVAAMMLFGWFAGRLGDVTMREAEQNQVNMTRMLAEHTTRTIEATDLILRVAVTLVGTRGLPTDEATREVIRHRILERMANVPQVRSLLVLDAEGRSILDSATAVARPHDASDRDYFQVHRDHPDAGLFVGAPLVSRLSGQPILSLSRRLSAPDGRFLGVAVVALDRRYFEEFHSTLNMGESASIALLRADGTMLTRQPPRAGASDKAREEIAATLRTLKPGLPVSHRSTSAQDGIERVRTHMKLNPYPIAVVVAIPVTSILQPVRNSRIAILAAGAVTALVLLGLFWLLARHMALKDASARQLEEAKAAAETGWLAAVESDKVKSQFWHGIGHDLRAPLCAIQTLVDLLMSGKPGKVTDAQRTHLGQIDKAVRLQFALVDDLSDSARLEAGALRLSERQCSLREIVSEVAALARPDAERNGLTLSVEPGLPELYLWADDQRLLQVAMNLVSNAVKYTTAPGRVTICYAVEANGDVAVRVSDTGIGMTPLEARHALRPYVRIDNERTRDQPGTGLGLSIARGLVELHGGTLTIDSAPGKGTTVTVRLPDERVLGAMPMQRLAG
ncbi:MAG: hypothetical protein JNM30_21990, partial [Rhodospirillales bacterium]|nr:hypothetical protein [Rhodospirillales bacterium]